MPEPAWKAYESQIFERLRQGAAAGAEITFDREGRQRLRGRFSRVDRQVDVLVRGQIGGLGAMRTMVVDCKHWTKKIDVGDVDAFVGFLLDVQVPLGLLVTSSDWSAGARNRAREQGAPDIDLDVVPFDELATWRPRRPSVAMTAGVSTGTVAYRNEDGELRVEVVSADLAQRLIADQYRDSSG